jgi:hypothetical protein
LVQEGEENVEFGRSAVSAGNDILIRSITGDNLLIFSRREGFKTYAQSGLINVTFIISSVLSFFIFYFTQQVYHW